MNVKIFGERHTATNAVREFIHLNFNSLCYYYDFLGWKHRRAPLKREWGRVDYQNTLFIFTVRNPYSWAKSMHREPYCIHQPQLKEISFDEFLLHPIEDYENILKMWNEKYQSYLHMADQVPNAIFIRMEDFIANQEQTYDLLKKYLSVKDNFKPYDKYTSGWGVIDKTIELEKVSAQLSQTQNEIIDQQLDTELVAKIGYILKDV